MSDQIIRVVQEGPVRWLWLNRPKQRNALNGELAAALAEQADQSDRDEGTAVVVIAGEGPSFCAGGDFRHFLEIDDADGVLTFLTQLSTTFNRIEESSKVWVAALHGHAIAGGLELALVCDVVVAAEGTLIGDGHLRNRLLPGAGSSVRLERAVGKAAARWLHLSGELSPAESLAKTGWLHSVVAPENLLFETRCIAQLLASTDPGAQQRFKKLLVEIERLDKNQGLARELEVFQDNWTGGDVASALREFLDARGGAPTLTQESNR